MQIATGTFEAGTYEYTPAAIAAEDMIVMVDKPAVQIGEAKVAVNFNTQYETVSLADSVSYPCSEVA